MESNWVENVYNWHCRIIVWNSIATDDDVKDITTTKTWFNVKLNRSAIEEGIALKLGRRTGCDAVRTEENYYFIIMSDPDSKFIKTLLFSSDLCPK